MSGSSFGKVFKISTFGESHGVAVGVIIDGCPAGIEVDLEQIQVDLDRRKPGQSKIVTQRKEEDLVKIQSGVFEGQTTGTPISLVIHNKDQKSKDYNHIKDKFRPSHADFTYHEKYGIRDYRGGGRSSARETVARVAAGGIAKAFLAKFGISITAFVSQVGNIKMSSDYSSIDFAEAENNIIRCPHPETAKEMISLIKEIKKSGDTIGGKITCIVQGVPVGIGEPVFDKLHADLAKAMMSINAVKGFEYGSGFDAITMKGSDHNDAFFKEGDDVKTNTNYSGGIQGGISNGMPINMNIAFKPVATLMKDQSSVDKEGKEVTVTGKGRHDPCVVPRAVPIVEAMAALVVADHLLRKRANKV